MRKPRRHDPKSQALAGDGALNPHPDAIRDPPVSYTHLTLPTKA